MPVVLMRVRAATYAAMEPTQKIAVGIREAAAMLSISPRSVQNHIRLKTLKARKIGRRTVIPVRSLEAFLRIDHVSPARQAEEWLRRETKTRHAEPIATLQSVTKTGESRKRSD
jgi:hypothetical protein